MGHDTTVTVSEGDNTNVTVNKVSGNQFKGPQTTVTTDTTLDGNNGAVFGDTSSNDITITLPPAGDQKDRVYHVKKTAELNTLTIQGDGTETIDGEEAQEITNQYDSVTIQSTGSEWFIL